MLNNEKMNVSLWRSSFAATSRRTCPWYSLIALSRRTLRSWPRPAFYCNHVAVQRGSWCCEFSFFYIEKR